MTPTHRLKSLAVPVWTTAPDHACTRALFSRAARAGFEVAA